MGVSKVCLRSALSPGRPARDNRRVHRRQSWRTSSLCIKTTPTGSPPSRSGPTRCSRGLMLSIRHRLRRPLAEGAVLKKKFDDIFAATKYTKALETIRKLKTDQAQGIRVRRSVDVGACAMSCPEPCLCCVQEKRLSLEALRAHKESAHKLRNDLEDAEKSYSDNLTTMNELEHEILQLQQKSDVLDGKLKKMTEIISALRLMEAQHETLVAENGRRYAALSSEVEGPLAQLEESLVCAPRLRCCASFLTRCAAFLASIRRNGGGQKTRKKRR